MIEVEAFLKRQHFTLDISIVLPEKVTAIFGPSGSGKTTLINIIAGIITPEKGWVALNGKCMFDAKRNINMPLYQRNLGMVFQDHRLFPHLSIAKNLTYGMHTTPKQSKISMDQVVQLLELHALLQLRPHQLSGGEKQRVALGRALLSSPSLLLLDEPLASLDHRLKQQILPYLKLVSQEIDVPMIYISHSMDEIEELTPHILHIQEGKLRL